MACDKTTRFLRLVLLLVLSLLCAAAPLGAQEQQYVPITRENVSEIVQLSRSGNGAVRALVLSADASRLAVASALGVWVINLDDDTSEPVLHEGQGGASSASFSTDELLVAGGGDDGSVMVWDTQTGETVTRLENHLYPVSAVAWSTDGTLLASGDWSGVVRVWDVATWSEYRIFSTSEILGTSVKLSRLSFDEELLIAGGSVAYVIWNVSTSERIPFDQVVERFGAFLQPDDSLFPRWLAQSGQVQVYRSESRIDTFDDFNDQLDQVFFTADRRVGASALTTPQLWSLETGKIDNAPLTSQIFSPDQSILATFGSDGIIRLLDAASGDQIAALYGHIRKINAVSFSPDGSLLVSASDDGTLQVWDATVTEDSGSLVTLEGHTSGVTSVAFNTAGTLIASTGYDGTVRTWGIPQ